MAHFLLWTVPWLNLYVDNVWVHGNDQTLYIYINYIFVEHNTVDTGESFQSSNPQTYTVFPCVEDSCYILFSLFSLASLHRIFPNSKEKNSAYVQISVDQYLLNDMQQILINNIKMYMNVRCAAMTSSKIANLTMLVEIRNAKTFYQKNM